MKIKNAGVAEQADARDFNVFPTQMGYKIILQRVPKRKLLEQKLAKTAKANTERRAKFWHTL